MKLFLSIELFVYYHSSVVKGIASVNHRSWVQICWRLLLKVTENIFLKVILYKKKIIYHLLFYIFIILSLYLSLSNNVVLILKTFIQVLWATFTVNRFGIFHNLCIFSKLINHFYRKRKLDLQSQRKTMKRRGRLAERKICLPVLYL